MPFPLKAENLRLQYNTRLVAENLSLMIPKGSFTAIVGPNACGKSTLLRALSRLLAPKAGHVLLENRDIADYSNRDLARSLAVLPQAPVAPDGITVADLVGRGRFAHQTLLRQWSEEDARAVEKAMQSTGISSLAERRLSELSGGQRQRVWIAMVLAQDTPVLLLDEPTTWLDIVHQVELLDLLSELHCEGRTIVTVLHELNLAFRYADHLVAMRDGEIVGQGAPGTIVTEELINQVFGLNALVIPDPLTGTPMVIPRPRQGRGD